MRTEQSVCDALPQPVSPVSLSPNRTRSTTLVEARHLLNDEVTRDWTEPDPGLPKREVWREID
ncbi:hypothetical protein ZHAS_00002116 [Anopheles sinensis]|uniref:Uncharacterized protein n=1 Tax=Anopheles sinensis TaxID=74873 RepID=A0A084VBT2_ANOSI|nr:hypothetical protein ZHAS_00002116 [Anopheles sinensis]